MSTETANQPIGQREVEQPTSCEPLNAVDRAMRAVDGALRSMGYPGFETQLLVWLSGRLDAARLRLALDRLAAVEPSIIARLHDRPDAAPHWRLSGNQPTLIETTLPVDSREAVLDFAADQLATPADPAANDPIRFHLIHRLIAGDVLLMQYNHTLMDNRGSVGLLRQINSLAYADANGKTPLPSREAGRGVKLAESRATCQGEGFARDPIRRYLRAYPRSHRRAAAKRALDVWWQAIRGGAATLHRTEANAARAPQLRVLSARLESDETTAFRARTVAACGLPATSMAILGCAFRALEKMSVDRGQSWVAGIGVDLGLRRPGSGALHNLMSILPISAARARVGEPMGMARQLNDQMREHLRAEIDLGILQLIATFARRPRQLEWAVRHTLAHGFSLWYGYFGSLDAIGREFLDVPVEDISYFGPCWSPIGVTLLAHEFRGRLSLQLTYLPKLVADPDAASFLSLVRAGLVEDDGWH